MHRSKNVELKVFKVVHSTGHAKWLIRCVFLFISLYLLLLPFLDSNLTIHQEHSTWNLAFYLCAPGSNRAPVCLLKIDNVEPHPRAALETKVRYLTPKSHPNAEDAEFEPAQCHIFKVGQAAVKCHIGQIWIQIGQICQIGKLIGQIEQTPDTSKMKILLDIYQIYFLRYIFEISYIFVCYLTISILTWSFSLLPVVRAKKLESESIANQRTQTV